MHKVVYRLKSVPRDEYYNVLSLVLGTATLRRSDCQADIQLPRLVTDDVEQLPASRQGYVRKSMATNSLHGCAWTGPGFIWLNPDRSSESIRRTLIHEICHLAVVDQSHGPKWRRLFGMSWAHYELEDNTHSVYMRNRLAREAVARVVANYRHHRMVNKHGVRVTYDQYCDNLQRESTAILGTALRKHDEVMAQARKIRREQCPVPERSGL